jgi:hypothetical protein
VTSDEQRKILKMVEDGRISAEEAMNLFQALGAPSTKIQIMEADPDPKSRTSTQKNLRKLHATPGDCGRFPSGLVSPLSSSARTGSTHSLAVRIMGSGFVAPPFCFSQV